MGINEVDRSVLIKEIADLFFKSECGFTFSKIRYKKGPKKIKFADFKASRKGTSFWIKFFGQPKNLSSDIISGKITDTKILKKLVDYRPYIHKYMNPKTDFYIAFFKTEGEEYKNYIYKPLPIDLSQNKVIDAALVVCFQFYLESLEKDERYRPEKYYSTKIRSDFFKEIINDELNGQEIQELRGRIRVYQDLNDREIQELQRGRIEANQYFYGNLDGISQTFDEFNEDYIGNTDNLLNVSTGNLFKDRFFIALSEIREEIS